MLHLLSPHGQFVERVPGDDVSTQEPHRRVLLRGLLAQDGAREHRVVAAAVLAQVHLGMLHGIVIVIYWQKC